MILEEFDSSKDAIINPWNLIAKMEGIPKVAVTCFSRLTFERISMLVDRMEEITSLGLASIRIPVYKALFRGTEIILYLSMVGAPACTALLEEIFSLGVERVVMYGTCGVLTSDIQDCTVIIPYMALRDEGVSYHYAPASDEIMVNENQGHVDAFVKIVKEAGLPYTFGKVWTIDAMYRETRQKMKTRQLQGCNCVDMECAAVSAVSKFRDKEVFQFFYAGDNLDAKEWEPRSLPNRSKLTEKDKVSYTALCLANEMVSSK